VNDQGTAGHGSAATTPVAIMTPRSTAGIEQIFMTAIHAASQAKSAGAAAK